eukprot:65135-Chlamydomonas_euryale.AAC.1
MRRLHICTALHGDAALVNRAGWEAGWGLEVEGRGARAVDRKTNGRWFNGRCRWRGGAEGEWEERQTN